MTAMSISVVLPIYNNGPTLGELHRRLRRVLDEYIPAPFELIFVVDASPDDSSAILAKLAESDPAVRVIALASNVGQNRALMQGLAVAQGDWIVLMDADLQDPPEAIAALIGAAQEHNCPVFAGQRGRYQEQGRMVTSRTYKRLLSFLTGLPPDASSFVALPRRTRDELLSFHETNPIVVALIGCTRGVKRSIPIAKQSRPVGHSGYTSWKRLRLAFRGLKCVARHRYGLPLP